MIICRILLPFMSFLRYYSCPLNNAGVSGANHSTVNQKSACNFLDRLWLLMMPKTVSPVVLDPWIPETQTLLATRSDHLSVSLVWAACARGLWWGHRSRMWAEHTHWHEQVRGKVQNGACQSLHPWRESQQVPAPPMHTWRLALNALHRCNSAFQTAAFMLDPGVNESACEPFKSGISISYSPMVLLDICLLVFKIRCFGSSSLKDWGGWCGDKPSLLRKKLCICENSPSCGLL